MHVTLHIGWPITGTSAFQRFLKNHRSALAERGFATPPKAHSAHVLLQRITRAMKGRERIRVLAEQDLDNLFDYGRLNSCPQLLLSSEYLAGAETGALHMLKDMLVARGATPTIRVVAYLREPIAWSTSYWRQSIKACSLTLDEASINPWRGDYTARLHRFMDVFGKANISIKIFDRELMKGGSIVTDLTAHLGADITGLPLPKQAVNSSLSHETILVANALTAFCPSSARKQPARRKYKAALQAIPGKKFVLPQDVQDQVVIVSQADHDFLRREFGVILEPKHVTPDKTPLSLTQDQARTIALEIDETIRASV